MTMNILSVLPLLLVLVSPSHSLQPVKLRDQPLWEPGVNPYASRIDGSCVVVHQGTDTQANYPTIKHNLEDLEIPESFDARDQWANCPSIQEISNQGQCGSCWAFGSVEAISDRICIHSNAQINVRISADDLVSCCDQCGGCNGSTIRQAYDYWVNHGIVSGGPYGSNEGCRPYEITPALEYFKSYWYGEETVVEPECVKQCESGYPTPYDQDLHFGKDFHHVENDVQQIQAEIMSNGPVTVSFTVFEDFRYNYTGHGIYHYQYGQVIDYHAVKLIGWGVQDGADYWIAANSWGAGWGENGFFKFIRGENNAGIEEDVWGGIPA